MTDLTKVFCAPFAAGYYGSPEHEGKRLVKVGCFDTRRSTTNLFGWPIERLYALVDLRRREVLSVTDHGVVPISGREPQLHRGRRRQLREAAQADGHGAAGRRELRITARGDLGQVAASTCASTRASAP